MSDMLNKKRALAKLRTELEGREGRICKRCGRFGHLTWNCRKGEEQKKRMVEGNRFKTLRSRVMQCGVQEVRRQEKVEEIVKCFGCGEVGHKKWECLRKRKKKEGRNGTSKGGLGKGKIVLQCKRTIPKRSQNKYRGVDNTERGSDLHGMLWV